MIRYLSGVSSAPLREVARQYDIGLLCQPGNGYTSQIGDYPYWAADNGCFSQGDRFNLGEYLEWLRDLSPRAGSCLFATAPDVVGDARATWERGREIFPVIRALGFPAALVAQNGLRLGPQRELHVHLDDRTDSWTGIEVPWDSFDVLFIGGDDGYKVGPMNLGRASVRTLVWEAKARGKRVHMGRVNSLVRLRLAQWMECDTADGTFLAFGPRVNLPRLTGWLEALRD